MAEPQTPATPETPAEKAARLKRIEDSIKNADPKDRIMPTTPEAQEALDKDIADTQRRHDEFLKGLMKPKPPEGGKRSR